MLLLSGEWMYWVEDNRHELLVKVLVFQKNYSVAFQWYISSMVMNYVLYIPIILLIDQFYGENNAHSLITYKQEVDKFS